MGRDKYRKRGGKDRVYQIKKTKKNCAGGVGGGGERLQLFSRQKKT